MKWLAFAVAALVVAAGVASFAIYSFGWHDKSGPADRSALYPDEAERARAYIEEYLSDGCDAADLKNGCRIVVMRRLGGHVWRARVSGIGFTTGNFHECIDVDVPAFAVHSNGSQDSTADRFEGIVAVRCSATSGSFEAR